MEILLLLALITFLFLKNGFAWIITMSGVWLGAGIFNPPITSNVVWFIATVASIITYVKIDRNIQS